MAAHTYISLFSGVGMLDLGLHLALPGARCVGYCEREGPAAAVLASRMAEGVLDEAPIYSDVRSVPVEPYRGRVAGIIGGFPCQDLSVAGRQAGIHGERSGLFFEIVRLVRELESVEWLFLENVPPVLAFPAGGTVLGELASLGFDAEWTTLRASDCGAPHRRDRAFILAYRNRLANTQHSGPSRRRTEAASRTTPDATSGSGIALAHTEGERVHGGGGDIREAEWRPGRTLLQRTDGSDQQLADAPRDGRSEGRAEPSGQPRRPDAAERGGDVEHAEREGRPQPEPAGFGAHEAQASAGLDDRLERAGGMVECGVGLADSGSEGSQGGERGPGSAQGPTREFRPPLFPPGPADADAWAAILAEWPDLAPAVEPGVRGVADGTANRVHRLRALGNGVVPLQAAVAFRLLADRAGVFGQGGAE